VWRKHRGHRQGEKGGDHLKTGGEGEGDDDDEEEGNAEAGEVEEGGDRIVVDVWTIDVVAVDEEGDDVHVNSVRALSK